MHGLTAGCSNIENYIRLLLPHVWNLEEQLEPKDQLLPNKDEVALSYAVKEHCNEKCPITMVPVKDLLNPVIMRGNFYERRALMRWIYEKGTCPVSCVAVTMDDVLDVPFWGSS
jgi:hypothetical protein